MNQRVVTGLLTAGCIALAGAGYMTYKNQDRTAPEIKVDQSKKIAYTEGEDYGKLLEGVTAQDDKDGDLTSEVFVEKVVPVSKKKAVVYYGVTDKAKNVGTASQEVIYQEIEDGDVAEETAENTASEDVSEDTTQKTDEKSAKKTKKKLEYGLPHEEYPKENVDQYMEELKKVIGLEKEPVAITFLFKKEDYDEYPIEEIKAAMPYCVMVKQAALQGKGIKSRLEHHKCDGATTALALEPSTEKIESGQEYFSYKLYSSVATARRLRSSIKSLHRMPVHNYGVAIVPLSQCVQTPDVIISICNAYQAMRYVQGYEYNTGKKPAIDMGAMQGMCSEVTVSPYLTGELNVSVLCPSTRMLCKWSENDMAVGIPFELFEAVTKGIIATQPNY